MGSHSDWDTMKHAAQRLEQLEIPYEKEIVSAHRTPRKLVDYAESARERGLKVIIAGAGGAAHCPACSSGFDPFASPRSSRSIARAQRPRLSPLNCANAGGGPCYDLGIGKAGAANAALSAASILSLEDAALADRYDAFRSFQTETVLDTNYLNSKTNNSEQDKDFPSRRSHRDFRRRPLRGRMMITAGRPMAYHFHIFGSFGKLHRRAYRRFRYMRYT